MYEWKEQSFTWPTESNVDTGVTIGSKNGRDCTELLNAKVLKSTSHVTHFLHVILSLKIAYCPLLQLHHVNLKYWMQSNNINDQQVIHFTSGLMSQNKEYSRITCTWQ